MSTSTYNFTPDALSKALVLIAAPDGLKLSEGTKPVLITWSDVMRVQIWFDPTRFNRQRYRCRVSTRGGKEITIDSTTCRGVGDFVSQPNEYRSLVEAIHEHVRIHGKNVAFSCGVGGSRYAINLFIAVVALAALSLTLMLLGVSLLGLTAIVHLIVIAAGARLAWKWLAKNRPATYDPKAIPASQLPSAQR